MSSVKANGLELDVTIFWSKGGDRSALTQKSLPLEGELAVGEDTALTIPGLAKHTLVSTVGSVTTVTPPAGATVFVDRLMHTGPFTLTAGQTADVTIGDFVVALGVSAAEAKPAADLRGAVRRSALGTILGSAFVHASIFASMAFFMPSLSEASMEDVNRDQIATMKQYLASSAAAEQDAKPETAQNDGSGAETTPSTKDPGGQTGDATVKDTGKKWAAQGDARPEDQKLARDHALAEASDFGLLQMLGTTDPKAPTVPWGTVMLGANKESKLGNLWGGDIGDALGTTYALSDGPNCTGPDCSHGVDLKDVGNLTSRTLSHCAGDHCDASGVDHGGPVPRGHQTSAPKLRPDPAISTNGHIDPEVIRRTVRQNEGRMIGCYTDGLRKNPGLEGRVAVKFVIGRDGSVTMAQDGASDLPDPAVRACVVQSFYQMSFAPPKDGTVRVTYPFTFSPQ
jgi:hypothetical protein